MANATKLKEKARTHEQKEQWKDALATYEQMLEESDGENSGLWNRIGDLYLRMGQTDQAVEAYEQAVAAYADAGLHNNAIALCNKILRAVPSRTPVYLKLGQISAAQGFLADARSSFLQYAERMQKAGQLDASFDALKEFAGLSPDDLEVRRVLAEQLQAHGRSADAVEQLRLLLGQLRSRGLAAEAEEIRNRIVAIDPEASVDPIGGAPSAPRTGDGRGAAADELGLDLLPTFDMPAATPASAAPPSAADPVAVETTEFHIDVSDTADAPVEALSLEGFETTGREDAAPDGGSDSLILDIGMQEGADDLQSGPSLLDSEGEGVGFLEGFESTGQGEEWEDAEDSAGLPLLDIDSGPTRDDSDSGDADSLLLDEDETDSEPLPLLSLDSGWSDDSATPHDAGVSELDLLEHTLDVSPGAAIPADETAPEPFAVPAENRLDSLRARYAAEPADAAVRSELISLLRAEGQGSEVEAVLDTAHRSLAADGLYNDAADTVRTLLDLRGDDTALYQKQVEYAFRSGDRDRLIRAYLDLGRHLESGDSPAKAVAVYQRVLELDSGNAEARRALAPAQRSPSEAPRSQPGRPAAAADEGYVDLAALIFDDEPQEPSTRFVVEEEEPTGDEERDFADMLSTFRQKVAENIGVEDSTSHYDLGLAFKDMGLLDEAISQFQVALRGGANPLATLEVLGECFIEKGHYTLASRVLDRALRLPDVDDATLIGVYYWLARCEETVGHTANARDYYERVLALDIQFRDASSRLGSLRPGTDS